MPCYCSGDTPIATDGRMKLVFAVASWPVEALGASPGNPCNDVRDGRSEIP